MKETHEQAVKRGRTSKASGKVFELRTRKDLEEKGWIVDRWTNNVEFNEEFGFTAEGDYDSQIQGKIIMAKPKFRYDFKTKMRIPVSTNSGFPDFMAFRHYGSPFGYLTEVIGVECKQNGKLDKEERVKCHWYLKNKIFSKILIASKEKIKNRVQVIYTDFLNKY